MKRIALLLAAFGAPLCDAAPGSWIASPEAPRPAVAGRIYRSAIAEVPPQAAGQKIRRVAWHWRASDSLRAWLCQREHCQKMSGPRGKEAWFGGRPAAVPLHFRFRLPVGATRAVDISQLSLTVEYGTAHR